LTDVVMLTKNSMFPRIGDVVAAVKMIPDCRLIVVDGGSTDGTREFFESQGAVVVDDSRGNRGTARQKGMDLVTSEFFAFVDSDVLLPPHWYEDALGHFTEETGGISTAIIQSGVMGKQQRALAALYRRKPTQLGGVFDTAAALVRTAAVRGFKIPPDVDEGEDAYIGQRMKLDGWECSRVSNPVAFHFYQEPKGYLPTFKGARLTGRYGWRTRKYMVGALLRSIPEGIFIGVYSRDFRAGQLRIRDGALALAGYLRGEAESKGLSRTSAGG
jgi:glycosyltransferase involved in cell wall biosynthesis